MKKKTKLVLALVFVLVVVLFACAVTVSAGEEYTSNGYTYTVTNGEATITDYERNTSGTLVIPATLGGYPVTTIGIDAFMGTDYITTVIVPEGVKTIKQEAFQYMFKLDSISIPASVTVIERNAFADCDRLANIVVENGNTAYASQDGVLFNKAKTTLIAYPAGKTDAPYTIPSTVTRIEQEAFKNCKNLTDVNIPTSVREISYSAFNGSGIYKNSANWTSSALIIDGCLVAMDDSFITEDYAPNIREFTVPNGVRLIASGAFFPCTSLKTLGLPESLKIICDAAIDKAGITKINYAGSKSQWETVSWNDTNWSVDHALRTGNFTFAKADPAKNGWKLEGGKWYFYTNNVKVTNKWMKDSKGWVYLGASGAMLTNDWCKDSVGWCYVGADGYAVTNCWKKDSVGWCYLNANGSMTKNAWVKDGGKWYYLDANGYMVSNKWMKDSKGWVYLGTSGAMLTNAWCKDSIGWCYVGADGYAVTNCWKKDSVGWCYLNANGSMTKNGWVQDGNKWYYCDGSGYMVANKSVKIGKTTYRFNASGVCLNP